MATEDLTNAKNIKADEFYTQMPDIEAELRHYKEHFKEKVVLCNCDDPYESNFFKYFAMNFNYLGLEKLIATSYSESAFAFQQLPLFDIKDMIITSDGSKPASKIEINEVKDENCDGAIGLADVEYLIKNKENTLTLLDGDGDFQSKECIEMLKEADIVVTNPPFSLFREYVSQLVAYNKKFLIIGNQNAVSYNAIFPLLRDNQLWLGNYSGDMEFVVPDHYKPRNVRYREENGIKYRSMGNICWYTNLDITKRHEELTLYKKYSPDEYSYYDNYDAINVDKVAEIPYDYDGIMGVPITFLDKYNPDQFEIVGNEQTLGIAKGRGYINGKRLYARIFIRRKMVA